MWLYFFLEWRYHCNRLLQQPPVIFQRRWFILQWDIRSSLSYPTNVTPIDNRFVAVSFRSSCGIEIIDIKDKISVRIIDTTSYWSGLSYRNGFLLFSEHANGISRVQLSDGSKSLLVSRNAVEYWGMSDYVRR